jgi:hypothetical protein
VRGNPPPEISWEKCNISKTTSCERVKVYKAKKKVRNESHTFLSSMFLDTSHEHVVKCIASNSLGSKDGSYVYRPEFESNFSFSIYHIINVST